MGHFFWDALYNPSIIFQQNWANESFISCLPCYAMAPGAITNYYHALVKTFDRYASQYKLQPEFYSLSYQFDR